MMMNQTKRRAMEKASHRTHSGTDLAAGDREIEQHRRDPFGRGTHPSQQISIDLI